MHPTSTSYRRGRSRRGNVALRIVGIGCLSIVILAGVGGWLAYRGVKRLATNLVDSYTDAQARALPVVKATPEEAREVCGRVDAFSLALSEGRPAAPLALTGRDVNLLIQNHPKWKLLADRVCVDITNDAIRGEASMPLDAFAALPVFGSLAKGRYLNGAVTFRVQLAAGRLLLFLDRVEVKGRPLPEEIMQGLRSQNLAQDVNSNTNTAAVLARLESLAVSDGALRIVPRAPAP